MTAIDYDFQPHHHCNAARFKATALVRKRQRRSPSENMIAGNSLLYALLLLLPLAHGFRLDSVAGDRAVPDSQLRALVRTSVEWLQFRSIYLDYPLLDQYSQQLQRVLVPSCPHCFDYFEAVALVKTMGKLVNQILKDDKEDVHYAVVRRSYVAAVWVLQRSRMFVWETSHLTSTVLSTMFRLYAHHVSRVKGRAVSFHHVSKCGGTTMCQLAASNRCSNPFLNPEKNCVLSSRLDGPIWLVAHDVTPTGAAVNLTRGALDAEPTEERYIYSRRYATEPRLPMWLMYSCPYVPNGRLYSCRARSAHVQESGTTFMANERTLSKEYGVSQVCPEFLNAVILRDPVPHVISLMAEVKYRYVRQLQFRHRITSWQPPAWNLTWWETFGPALVGNYATRTLLGRESFCRSARNMSVPQLAEAVDALLSFDVVMTLGRSNDVDLMISTVLGWPAQNFTSQPKARVRDVATSGQLVLDRATVASITSTASFLTGGSSSPARSSPGPQPAQAAELVAAGGADSDVVRTGDSSDGQHRGGHTGADSVDQPGPQTAPHEASPGVGSVRSIGSDYNDKQDESYGDSHYDDSDGQRQSGNDQDSGAYSEHDGLEDGSSDSSMAGTPNRGSWSSGSSAGGSSGGSPSQDDSDAMFERAAAALDIPFEEPPPPPALPPEVVAAAGAVSLVRSSWLERQALLMGYPNVSAAGFSLPEPIVEHLQPDGPYGAHLVRVTLTDKAAAHNVSQELWHAFPRHAFAFTDTDMAQLESLTRLDSQLVQTADVLLDLDVAWLRFLLHNHHYRKKMKAVASTYTACGFAGMMPLTETVQSQIFR